MPAERGPSGTGHDTACTCRVTGVLGHERRCPMFGADLPVAVPGPASVSPAERDERLLRAIGVADRASTSMAPYGPMNDRWMRGFLDALTAEGLAIVEDDPDGR